MAQHRAPKQWRLTTIESITSFENWRQNLIYILSLDPNFADFLRDDATWLKKSATNPTRGLEADAAPIPADARRTAAQKCTHLELMLGQIANWAPVISRNSTVKQAKSVKDIWQKLREHYGFQSTGAHFLELANIGFKPDDERPEDLFQRIMAFFEDNLLCKNSLKHHDEVLANDEEMTPTLENVVCVLWLQHIHPSLPQLIKQKYGADLRNKTIASIKSEISQALPSLLDEIHSIEDAKVMRSFTPRGQLFRSKQPKPTRGKSCTLCKAAGRPHTSHFLSECKLLPDQDRRAIARSRFVGEYNDDDDNDLDEDYNEMPAIEGASALIDKPSVRSVHIEQSPVMNCYFNSHRVPLTLDTGATTNMIRVSFAKYIGLPMTVASQMARQADGVTFMKVCGEVHCELVRGDRTFQLDALVVDKLDVDILAGVPFLALNDIATRPALKQIVIKV